MKRLIVLMVPLALAGCSQINSLQQVSGVPLASVEIAANDVLVEKGVPILTAPNCTETTEQFNCQGETLGGKTIEVQVVNNETMPMTIKVGGKEIFSGTVQEVIVKAGEEKP